MLKILFLSLITGILLGGSACKQEALATYSAANSIYFNNYTIFGNIDSSNISFAYADSTTKDSAVQIVVQVTGSPTDKDRPFKLVADPSSTAVAGQDYAALSEVYQLPAHQVTDTITIKLLRSADLKDQQVSLLLDLQPNESFTTNLKEGGVAATGQPLNILQYKILFSDILVQPLGWDGDVFGKFSPKKMDIICSLGGISANWLNAGDDIYPVKSPNFYTKCDYLADLLNNYLAQMANAGTPVYYEDGITLMATDDY